MIANKQLKLNCVYELVEEVKIYHDDVPSYRIYLPGTLILISAFALDSACNNCVRSLKRLCLDGRKKYRCTILPAKIVGAFRIRNNDHRKFRLNVSKTLEERLKNAKYEGVKLPKINSRHVY